jgi:hypothetical protein
VCGCLLTQQQVELDARDRAGGALAYLAQGGGGQQRQQGGAMHAPAQQQIAMGAPAYPPPPPPPQYGAAPAGYPQMQRVFSRLAPCLPRFGAFLASFPSFFPFAPSPLVPTLAPPDCLCYARSIKRSPHSSRSRLRHPTKKEERIVGRLMAAARRPRSHDPAFAPRAARSAVTARWKKRRGS